MISVEKDKLYPWREQCTYMFSSDFRGAKQKSARLWTRTVNHQQTAPYLQDCACQQSKFLSYLLVLTTTEYKSQVLGNKCLEQPVKYAQQHPASNRQPNTCYQQATEPFCLCSFFTASCKCSTWGRYPLQGKDDLTDCRRWNVPFSHAEVHNKRKHPVYLNNADYVWPTSEGQLEFSNSDTCHLSL